MLDDLRQLYTQIHRCHLCPEMNKTKALRNADGCDRRSDVFIVSQALAQNTLRLSGINFFRADGLPGSTGRNIEIFLNKFSQTIYPPKEITLTQGVVIPQRKQLFRTVYNTEITQCFPGKLGTADRKPSTKEISTCYGQGFLEQELVIIKPKIILLMGDVSRKTFYKLFVRENRTDTLTKHCAKILRANQLDSFEFCGRKIFLCPIQHPSGVNPRFKTMANNLKLVGLIRDCLK